MAKLEYRKAGKDYPEYGIRKGDMHYTWEIFNGRTSRWYRQLTHPRRSQLTGSEFLGTVYDIEDDLQGLSDLNDLQDIIDRLEQLKSDTREKFDNVPEGLQQGDTGQLLESRADGISAAKDELMEILDEYEQLGYERNADGEIVAQSEDADVPDDASDALDELINRACGVTIEYS